MMWYQHSACTFQIACETIRKRLEPFKAGNPKGTWDEWVKAAYFARVGLSATGYYSTPGVGYDWNRNAGNAFNYFTYGAACSEVEVDCLTGDHQVLRTDIVMDLGVYCVRLQLGTFTHFFKYEIELKHDKMTFVMGTFLRRFSSRYFLGESLNPAIDIGQIEGGFMQGYGLFVLEEMVYLSNGSLFTRGPGAYKIPGFADVPVEFNVSLLKGAPNARAVYSSKVKPTGDCRRFHLH